MTPQMYDTEAPISDADLDALEERLRITLPAEYRAWLLKYNGGRPVPGTFQYKHETGPYTDGRIAWFFAVYDGQFENFERKFQAFKRPQRSPVRLPDDLVPIARDGFGNLICMAFDGPNKGKIYFRDHEEEGPHPSYDNCHLIADSFQEFIDRLH